MARLDRFQCPTSADDFLICVGCGRRVHYEDCIEDDNFCFECADAWCSEDVKAMNEKHETKN